jgi:hypothetical protein
VSVLLYLNPMEYSQRIPIPMPCVQHITSLLQKSKKSYHRIFQITLENIEQGIVGIASDVDHHYYRVTKEKVLRVKDSYSRDAEAEEKKIRRLNELITEIIEHPEQFQLPVHLNAEISMDRLRVMFSKNLQARNHVLVDVLECHPRTPGTQFIVAVGVSQEGSN